MTHEESVKVVNLMRKLVSHKISLEDAIKEVYYIEVIK